ncbi:thioesterase family protein [Agromyces sp. Leaf222]|uniref:acyl-CoA thioesterase n=1 Tax=Agromyces sp. Leaf222 TaxID=1735688 RepID=UPI0006FB7AE0|nr:thioesterase family protein [Agromyces sp. Leaf222]KQM81368.1 thioesterase [Agromyces sp. Leaf222]
MTHRPERRPFTTRWNDNDQYGHVNNTVYYEAMDTAVNTWMIEHAGLDPLGDEPIGLVVSSNCEFRASASFPEPLEVAIGVERLGSSSITWSLGIHRAGETEAIAEGRFVHVFVDAATRRPVPIPGGIRSEIEARLLA